MMMDNDSGWNPGMSFHTEANYVPSCLWMGGCPPEADTTDPYLDELNDRRIGNKFGFWDGDYDRGNVISDMCTQYGVDKWDIIVWYMTWIIMGQREGVLDDMDLGFGTKPYDPGDEEFMKQFMEMIVYRKGYWGNLFAEGMGRVIRELGREKYGNTVYKGIISNVVPGLQLDIPISWESAWGHCFHWQGRGYQGINHAAAYLPATLLLMTNTRDAQTNSHIHDTIQYMHEVEDDPCHNVRTAVCAVVNEDKAELKESVTTCDWQCPNPYWTDMETEMLYAATGLKYTEEELDVVAKRGKNLFRAILMRNHGRTRQIEVDEVYPALSYPDCEGVTTSREDYEALVDHYYSLRGWDLKTGWPTRETWVKTGLADIASEMEKLGLLPE